GAAVDRLFQTVDPMACGAGCAGAVDAARALGVPDGHSLGTAAAATAPARLTAGARRGVARWRTVLGVVLLVALAALCLTAAGGPSPPSRRS
ncbi:MAG TPA: hypothetical protein VMU14_15360, partial [Acidimicrobiales bacterium]|nr:hypothetical protein [Acidimicrobiales bacterium]